MVKIQRVQQKARIILNSDDASKTLNNNYTVPVRLAPITFDGSSSTIVDIANSRIFVMDHRLTAAEPIVYTTTGTPIGGLVNGTTYYAGVINTNVIQIKDNAGDVIPFSSTGVGNHFLTRTIQFNGSDPAVVNVDMETIRLPNHNLNTGDIVQYTTTGTATVIDGLVKNNYYYIIKGDDDTIQLASSYENATRVLPIAIPFGPQIGVGATHQIKKIIQFTSTGSPIVDTINEQFNIPGHGFETGDRVQYQVGDNGIVIGGLVDNFYYYIIKVDPDSFKLADTVTDAFANFPLNIITMGGSGNNHSFTKIATDPVPVCTNYNFRLNNLPFHLTDKCRLAVSSFVWVKNYPTFNCKSVGGVYCKSISPVDTYSTQGYYKGNLLLPAYFGENITYHNADIEQNCIPMPEGNQLLQNGLDIFIDTKKMSQANQDISGNIDEDKFNLELIIYEIDDFEYVSNNLNEDARNLPNVRMR